MLFADLIKGLNVLDLRGNIDIEIDGIAYDSRKVGKGYVFVCIDGTASDGHEFAGEALRNGAAAFITQRDIAVEANVPIIRTEDTRKALALISDRFYGHLSERFNLIGITGTKGKTTTTFMIKSILEASGHKVGLVGTLGTRIGDRVLYSERTTPESLDLQELFSQMVEEGVDDVVMEVSSQGLALQRVCCCDFDTGVFTNLSRDHISEREHASMEEYLLAKCMLFKMCRKGMVNLDSEYAPRVMEQAECEMLTFGIEKEADICAANIAKLPDCVEFDIKSPWYTDRLKVNIPGRFSIYNALAATGVCGLLGVPAGALKAGLERVQVPGRAESVDTGRDFSVIIDYAHTPDSLENILTTVKDYAAGRVICVFGCGGDRDRTKRPIMGAISGRIADYTVITSDNPRTEEPRAIIEQIEEGIKTTDGEYCRINDRREAIRHALMTAKTKDVVVLAGKGHETYQTFGDRTIHFDEREIVREILNEMAENKRS
ncbi:MAG TPA: UDP-N-acetylmuramoyl-L-alanyl-D-glutamate--2,6-diaminopimelate ligase [Clostridia bacterium]|nr:UDP-N-acetylmuramoyl-L-alanyl-D-glutamate--2,6-diaminopimelate ligase [Clostridia bacterium]